MRRASIVTMAVGIVVIAASFAWPSLAGGRRIWTDQQAQAYSQAGAEFHRLTYEAAAIQDMAKQRAAKGNPRSALADARLADAANTGGVIDPATATTERTATELAAAEKRYKQLRVDLENARESGQSPVMAVLLAGAGLFLVGLIGVIVSRANDPNG